MEAYTTTRKDHSIDVRNGGSDHIPDLPPTNRKRVSLREWDKEWSSQRMCRILAVKTHTQGRRVAVKQSKYQMQGRLRREEKRFGWSTIPARIPPNLVRLVSDYLANINGVNTLREALVVGATCWILGGVCT